MVKKIVEINAETWKADGGACFGVVPKSIWSKHIYSDENNMITLSNRLLLVETDDNRKILFNTGMGKKRTEKYYQYKYVENWDSLEESLSLTGYNFSDITDVVFTHLHDDHCGGAVKITENSTYFLVFPNAIHWCSSYQLDNMKNSNLREKASYFFDNVEEIIKCGKLKTIDKDLFLYDGIFLKLFHGHTFGQIIPFIEYQNKTIVYVSDFIPSAEHIPIHYIPAFDIQPLLSMKEKEEFLSLAVENDYILFFEHDYQNCCATVVKTEKGFFAKNKYKSLADALTDN